MSDAAKEAHLPGIDEIMAILPHRYPFLLVDRVLELERGKRAVCIKNVTFNEPHFTGHFPDFPIMPGVLITEALAQAGACLVIGSVGADADGKLPLLTGIDKAKFRRPVRPGDQLRMEIELGRMRQGFGKTFCRATVDGELAAEMTISFALSDAPKRG
jgi:3-hydroxyacyl-[acyl-carrier-protein] dehydratase